MNPMLNQVVSTLSVFLALLMVGCGLGLLLWFLMIWFTKPDYGYGLQHVKLASLGKRGAARLIDMGVVLASTGAVGWLITRKLDWLTLGEVINLRIDHPVIGQAVTAAALAVIWLVILAFSLLLTQAYWGTTPGKWLCGIRLLRTTLQPCGVARVIVREALFWWVDVVCLCWWIPGIVGIALSEKRQRLGDLAADTIVIAQSRQNSKATSETKESHANHGT
jgi:uncharacterized RDD family membrane protein YckC